MPNEFNAQEYRRKLIERGFTETSATELATRTAIARKTTRSATKNSRTASAIKPAADVAAISKPTPTAAPDERPKRVARKTVTRTQAKEPAAERRTAVDSMAEQVVTLTEKKRRTRATAGKSTATAELAETVNEVQQAAVRNHTIEQIKESQLSLFDLAPWPDHMRALPNDFGRSAIFTVRNKKVPRAALQGHSIYHINKDVEITYTGIELRADDDELVFAQVLEYAKRTAVGEPVSFTIYELCKDMGWPINGRYYAKAEECLTRLQASAMQFVSQRIGRLESLSLIRRFRVLDRGKRTSRCQVEIDAEIVVLFAGDHYTKFVWEKYQKLTPTARRMFDYFATHKEPFPLKLETFRLICGSDSTRPKKWREQVGKACDELRETGLVESVSVIDDLVHCKR